MRRGVLGALLVLASALPLAAQSRVGDLTFREGEIPVRLVGYGLVVGLDGTGDRSFGSNVGAVHTVRSVTNLLRRFNVEIPADRLRLRNVAAVLVTAEVPAYLRPGARFEVQVASVGDATSLKGGVLWMTPLLSGPDAPPIATAQGALPVATGEARTRYGSRGAASGRIAAGGIGLGGHRRGGEGGHHGRDGNMSHDPNQELLPEGESARQPGQEACFNVPRSRRRRSTPARPRPSARTAAAGRRAR